MVSADVEFFMGWGVGSGRAVANRLDLREHKWFVDHWLATADLESPPPKVFLIPSSIPCSIIPPKHTPGPILSRLEITPLVVFPFGVTLL